MTHLDQAKIAHLVMVQNVITRMASNSFILKVLTVMLTVGVLVYNGTVTYFSPKILLAALVPLVMLWGLNARYLQLERLFRQLYDAIQRDEVKPYSMDIAPYAVTEQHLIRIALSRWVVAFYVPIVLLVLLLFALSPSPRDLFDF